MVDTYTENKWMKIVKEAASKTGSVHIGDFSAILELPKDMHDPVLLATTDGVGTKIQYAISEVDYQVIGRDLVAMCVNDITVKGGKPLYFLDYYSTHDLNTFQSTNIIEGIVQGCVESGCQLVGGETALMPTLYPRGAFDLAGFAIGVAERDELITGETIVSGNHVYGIPTTHQHANGFTYLQDLPLKSTPFYKVPQNCEVVGAAHITGGGLTENIERILPPYAGVLLDIHNWERPKILHTLGWEPTELLKHFNCGIGWVIITNQEIENEEYIRIGDVISGSKGQVAYKGSVLDF